MVILGFAQVLTILKFHFAHMTLCRFVTCWAGYCAYNQSRNVKTQNMKIQKHKTGRKMKKIYSGAVIIGLLGVLTACAPQVTEERVAEVVPGVAQDVAQVVAQVSERLDEREMLPLNQIQREHVLQDMRNLLAGTQMVIEGLAEEDMQLLHDASALINKGGAAGNKADMQKMGMGKVLPPEFRQMGQVTRAGFKEISDMATNGATQADIQRKLVDVMHNCAACHAAYQIPNP